MINTTRSHSELFFFEKRRDSLILVAKRKKNQERIAGINVTTFDDKAIDALFRLARELNKDDYEVKIVDTSEKIGACALTIFAVGTDEIRALKERYIQILKEG